MPTDDNHTPPDPLSRLIAFDANDRAIWPADELRAHLRRQLEARLDQSLSAVEGSGSLVVLAAGAQPPIHTFGDLLRHPFPPVDLLWIVKDLAKLDRDGPRSVAPPDISLLIYYATIVLAMVRCGRRITTLTDDELRAGLSWAAKQSWMDEDIRDLFLDGLRYLRSTRNLWRS